MVTSTGRLSYEDCYDIMDSALDDPVGKRVWFRSKGEAWQFRIRLNYARIIDRRDNTKIYPDPMHKMHGNSKYDLLMFRLVECEDEGFWINIEKRSMANMVIESMSEGKGTI